MTNQRVAGISGVLMPVVASLLATVGCIGKIGSAASQGGPVTSGPLPDAGPASNAGCANHGPPSRAPLRRLNRFEYNNTIHDLLGETTRIADDFPPDEQGGGFSNNADALLVSHLLAESYAAAAATMAANAVKHLNTLYTCNVIAEGEVACAQRFIATFGKRAFRRPLTSDETARFQALFTAGRAGGRFEDGVATVLETMLQSPPFLYRVEPAAPGENGSSWAAVTPYQLATRLSYFFWGSMPDDELFAAADADALATPSALMAQATRLMKSDRARPTVATFHREWLELLNALEAPKAAAMFPAWSPALASALFAESQTFVEQTFWTDGGLHTLLTAPFSYANDAVGKYYGLTTPLGATFDKVALDPAQRAGILTQGTFLAAHAGPDQTSPVRRGKFVREQLLCQTIPPPPNNIVIRPPQYDPKSSTRQRYTDHETKEPCHSCHAMMDPIGFGFEHYDPIGQWRTMDGPATVDISGTTLTGTDVDGPFAGAVQLADRLSASADVSACVIAQWFRFAAGRVETDDDRCTLDDLGRQFAASHQDMRTLPIAIAASDAFRYRPAQIGGAP
jgi:hypothetical protein